MKQTQQMTMAQPARNTTNTEQKKLPRRIEVSQIVRDNGASEIILRDLNFAQGLGWYTQKSIAISEEEIGCLLANLASMKSARPKRQRKKSIESNIIELSDYLVDTSG